MFLRMSRRSSAGLPLHPSHAMEEMFLYSLQAPCPSEKQSQTRWAPMSLRVKVAAFLCFVEGMPSSRDEGV